ncbi:hypothetical protein BKA67DRAFT_565644 [Truncatella angustata]|uniref:Uncharacterized protein n=1 Tax=Truncatella angustata TaxID=152316 RepID=A0A9P8UM42_9PEZI|nr:uncharacterized protein BKA67DRAFT_565644 [Truncatella angustata]KAH6654586.1 hypothetical protein BKA67DRAFT_565644 [Truncatella angustata]
MAVPLPIQYLDFPDRFFIRSFAVSGRSRMDSCRNAFIARKQSRSDIPPWSSSLLRCSPWAAGWRSSFGRGRVRGRDDNLDAEPAWRLYFVVDVVVIVSVTAASGLAGLLAAEPAAVFAARLARRRASAFSRATCSSGVRPILRAVTRHGSVAGTAVPSGLIAVEPLFIFPPSFPSETCLVVIRVLVVVLLVSKLIVSRFSIIVGAADGLLFGVTVVVVVLFSKCETVASIRRFRVFNGFERSRLANNGLCSQRVFI